MSTRREFLHETTYGALTALTAISGVAEAGRATRNDPGFAGEAISPSDLDSDHGGLYLWGKEKLVELEGEHPVLTDFKREYYAGRSVASDLARAGYVVVVIDMFYWGERRMLLADDPADWRERPRSLTKERIDAFNRRSGEGEQLVGRTLFSAGLTWAGVMFWDDVRTVDY